MDKLTQQSIDLATIVSRQLIRRQWLLASAESCTGGLLAKTCTDLAGSSAWFDRAYVTYSNQAKVQMLGVSADLIDSYGAVSEPVAEAMLQGVLQKSDVQVAVSITGIAGPAGGSEQKPVGSVCFGIAVDGDIRLRSVFFEGDRAQIRQQSVNFGLQQILNRLN